MMNRRPFFYCIVSADYTIDNVGTDSETSQILYAINLDKKDFDLGEFSIYNLRF